MCSGVAAWKRNGSQGSLAEGGGRERRAENGAAAGCGAFSFGRHIDNPFVTVEPDREMLYKVPPAPRALVIASVNSLSCTDVKGVPQISGTWQTLEVRGVTSRHWHDKSSPGLVGVNPTTEPRPRTESLMLQSE